MLLSPRARKTLQKILIVEFKSKLVTTIMAMYSPINAASVADEYYRDLATAVCNVPEHNFLAILWNFNAMGKRKDLLVPVY